MPMCWPDGPRFRPGPDRGHGQIPPALLGLRMTRSRPGRIWGLVGAQAADSRGRVSAADACEAAVAAVDVTGAWLSTASGTEAGHVIRVTNAGSEQLAELQLTLGEGPSLDAAGSGGPGLASDLGARETARRWPALAPAACQARAGSVARLPLRAGAVLARAL